MSVILILIYNATNPITYTIKIPSEKVIQSTREFLRPVDEKYIVAIPETVSDYKDVLKALDEKDLQAIMYPKLLTYLKAEYLQHVRLQHTSHPEMFDLCEHGHLPKNF